MVKSPFDFLNDLNQSKQYLYSDETKSKYEPFMINRGFSQHSDTIFYANEMNKNPQLDKQLQHDFYYHIVDKRKRYGKWAKAGHDEMVGYVVRHYGVNKTHAKQYLDLLSDDDIKNLKTKYETGGRS